jgi:hypothetical protein
VDESPLGHEVVLMYYSRSRCCKGFEPYTFRFFRDGSFDEGYHVGSKPKVPQNEKGARRLPMSLRVCRSGGDSHALETYDFVGVYTKNPPARRKPLCPLVNSFVIAVPLMKKLLQLNYSMEHPVIETGSEQDCRPRGRWRIAGLNR